MNGSRTQDVSVSTLAITGNREGHWRVLVFYCGCWTLVGLYAASMDLLSHRSGIEFESFLRILGMNLMQNYGWGVVSLGTVALVRKVPLHHGNNVKAWSIHAIASVFITCVGIAMMVSVVPLYYVPLYSFWPRFWRFFQSYFHYCYLVYYWGVVGLHEGVAIFRHSKERESTAYLLEAKLAQAQLQALKMQLNPHFLFNTLNAVSALMHSDPETADRMLVKLGSLLRLSLDQSREQETSLNKELAFLESYLEIEQLRFGDRLKVTIEVSKPLMEARVPTFLLQPLVENAIKHGLSDRASGGTINIRASVVGQRLCLDVEDDGPGDKLRARALGENRANKAIKEGSALAGMGMGMGMGIGTRNTVARLQQLYGDEQSFELSFPPHGGALARISLPFSIIKDSPLFQGGLP